jgi:hypothetical protein
MRVFGDGSAIQLLGPMGFDFVPGKVYSEAAFGCLKEAVQQARKDQQHPSCLTTLTRIQSGRESDLIHNCTLNMVGRTSKPSSRSSSVTAPVDCSSSSSQHHALTTSSSLRAALKKPFQGWSKDLLRARDNDDDDYNFSSGMRRGAQYYQGEA